MQTYLEQAFGKSDCSSVKMRGAVREWMDLYYGASRSGEDGAPHTVPVNVSRALVKMFRLSRPLPPMMPTLMPMISPLSCSGKE